MGMTSDEMGRVTLAEFEAMAERFAGALKVLREAQSLLGAPVAVAAPAVPVHTPPVQHQLSQSELATKARLMKQFKSQQAPELPDDIASAEEQ